MKQLILPQIAFAANYEDDIKTTIFDAMDCSLWCNKRFDKEYRWFKEFPEFVLIKAPMFHNKTQREISRDHGKYFEMSIDRINALYTLIRNLFPNQEFISYHKKVYPITIHQIFRLGENVWANVSLQSVFYCQTPVLPEEYSEWMYLAKHYDYTYMMSDSRHSYDVGFKAEQKLYELQLKLDKQVCVLWYNYILGRMRLRPQDGSFGIHDKDSWNTLAEAYIKFNIQPQQHSNMQVAEPMVNTPCLGFPVHPKKQGWKEGDWNMEYYYSGSRPLTYEEYLQTQTEVQGN